MDLPQPPADQELKNIIDKLAQFVARNGPEFEHMTKQKQKDNPKFSFLFGGNYFHYYQYRVTTEQAILKQKQRSLEAQQAIVQQAINRQSIQSAPWQQPSQPLLPPSAHEQILQSEQNLAAQHQLLLQQQQVQVDEAIRKAQEEKLIKASKECELDLKELDGVLQPIIGSCTKDSISTGKGWIFAHATNNLCCEVIVNYILKKVTEPGASFEMKLHLVYLINDVLHHCIRKNADDLKKSLERVVVPVFCSTSIGVDPEKQQKLNKLYKLWETNKYFSQAILDQLQNPSTSLAAYQAGLIAEHATLIAPITTAVQAQYSLLQKQHQDFVAHLTGQMHHVQPSPYAFQPLPSSLMPVSQPVTSSHQSTSLRNQQQPFDPNLLTLQVAQDSPTLPMLSEDISKHDQLEEKEQNNLNQEADADQTLASTENGPKVENTESDYCSVTEFDNDLPHSTGPAQDFPSDEMHNHESRYSQPDQPNRRPNGRPIGCYSDDYSPHYGHQPPPGYPMEPPEYRMTPPHLAGYDHPPYRDMPIGPGPPDMPLPGDYVEHCAPPYYDLPAGLMVPLVKLEDTDYNRPLDPDDVRLPPPALPTERLLAAVEQFYCPPTNERTRNNSYIISSEGWEQLGLYEFFKAKAQARKQKGLSEENKEYTISMDLPAMQNYTEKPQQRRHYQEIKNPEEEDATSQSRNFNRSKRRSRSVSRSRSRSHSPESDRRASRSPSPRRPHFQRSRGRSRSCTPEDDVHSPNRSPTPPSFGRTSKRHDHRLDESNKGHQLLKKMGWSGAGGLGASEQGIQDPVDAGDVRDRQDMYKGIGSDLNDPYENFRKSKGQAFINRMKARAEELGKI